MMDNFEIFDHSILTIPSFHSIIPFHHSIFHILEIASCFVLNDDNESCTQIEDNLESILINVAGNQRRKTKTIEAEMEVKKRKRKSKLFYVSCDYVDVHGIGSGIDLQVPISFELKDKLFLTFVSVVFSITNFCRLELFKFLV